MNETTLPLPLPLRDPQGRPHSRQSAWAPTQPSALQTGLSSARPGWLRRKPGQLSLSRALVLATAAHVLLVLLVGTQQGSGMGGGGRPAATVASTDISIRLQDPAPLGAAPVAASPAAEPVARPPARQRANLPSTERRTRPSAPDLAPAPVPQAGQAPRGAVLRGVDTGLPAAPAMADLQPPPLPRQDAPPLAPVLAVPAPKAPERAEPPRAVTDVPASPPALPNNLPDARPQKQPALVEADRVTLPRTEDLTRGAADAARKVIAAPVQASEQAAPPLPAVAATAGQAARPTPVEPAPAASTLTDERQPTRLPLPAPVPVSPPTAQSQRPPSERSTAAPVPPPVPALVQPAPPVLQTLPPQTAVQARELPLQAPVALPAPPVAVAPPPEPAAPRVLGQQPSSFADRMPAPAPIAAVPELPALPALAAPPPAAPSGQALGVPAQLPSTAPVPLPAGPQAVTVPLPAAVRAPLPGVVQPGSAGPAALPVPAGLDGGLRGIVNVPPPPSRAASAPEGKLNLELPRAGALPPTQANQRLDPLRLTPPPADPRSKLARDIEKAGKADCRNAHGDKGLLAAPALVLDALNKDGGCKW
jgi:hypothetical protein